MEHQREYFRIPYPEHDRPTLIAHDIAIPVLDLCERGARVLVNSVFSEQCGPKEVRIVFADGIEFRTRAFFVWTDANTTALQFEASVPFPRILAEQLRLRKLVSHLD